MPACAGGQPSKCILFLIRLVNMVSFDVEVDEVTDSGISCTVTIPSGPLDVSVYVMATFYADVTKGKYIQ